MPIKYFKTLSIGTVAAGSTTKNTYSIEESGTLKYILVNERSNANLNAVMLTITLSGETFTRSLVPATVLGYDMRTAYPIDKTVKNGDKLEISVYNGGTSNVTVDVIIVIEE